MEGTQAAIRALRELKSDKLAADGLKVQIAEIEADMVHLSEMGYIQGESIPQDKRMKALIDRKNSLETQERVKREHIRHAERVLGSLPKRHREVLETFFCSGLEPGEALRKLERVLNIEQAQVYKIRKRALRNFAYRMGFLSEGDKREAATCARGYDSEL